MEMLAYHYLQAVEPSRAAERPIEGFAAQAREALIEAGDRAFALNSFATSARYYGEALALGVVEPAQEGDLLARRARALRRRRSRQRNRPRGSAGRAARDQ